MKHTLFKISALAMMMTAIISCSDANIASYNTRKSADNFEVNRRIVFYNGITDNYILEIEGRCSFDLNDSKTAFNVICKTGEKVFKRHTLVLSDNVTAFVEQIEPNQADSYFYRVIFKPSAIVPDMEIKLPE